MMCSRFSRLVFLFLSVSILFAWSFAIPSKTAKSPFVRGAAALPSSSVSAHRALLYAQLDGFSESGAVDQNYETDYNSLDSECADDFVVPDGVSWNINQVDTIGFSRPGDSSTATVNIAIYADVSGMPGAAPLFTRTNITPVNSGGSFQIPVSPIIHLEAGHYWLAIQTNQDFMPGGRVHYWGLRNLQSLNGGVWRNPDGGQGTSCTSWGRILPCLDNNNPDFLFSISGDIAQPIPALDHWGLGALLVTLVAAGYWVATRRNG